MGVGDLNGDASLWRLDPSVADGSVEGAVEVEVSAGELALVREAFRRSEVSLAEMSPSGESFALFLGEVQGAERSATIRFFGASGKPRGLVGAPFDAPWSPADSFEWSPVDLFGRFAGMGALGFEEGRMRLGYAGLSVIADIETGALTVVDTA